MPLTTEEIRQRFVIGSNEPVPLVSPPPVVCTPRVLIEQSLPSVVEEVVVRPAVGRTKLDGNDGEIVQTPIGHTAQRMMTADGAWDWSDLRDYVAEQIESRFGVFPRNPVKESGIFKSFLARYGELAVPIAKYAFEVKGGFWKGAPISVNRFCRGSDPYFGDLIKQYLLTLATVQA